MRRPSGAWTIRSRAMVWVGRLVISWPVKTIEPSDARGRPKIVIISVVLPAPLPPISATTSPAWMSRLTPCSTWMRPYLAVTFRI
jgi:hypothetical protein